jgi:hypothetical protein
MEKPHHETLDVPVPILLGVIGALLGSFAALTYLMSLVMDALRG